MFHILLSRLAIPMLPEDSGMSDQTYNFGRLQRIPQNLYTMTCLAVHLIHQDLVWSCRCTGS